MSLEQPTYGAQRIANELRLQNVNVSPSGGRGVWAAARADHALSASDAA